MKHIVTDRERTTVSLSLWKSIALVILLAFVIVSLFGVIIFLFVSGGQRLGLSTAGYVAMLVIISGIFAWLLKRISDTASGLSHLWFSEEADEQE
jgi:uncharacterized membrane protein YqjE